MKSLGQLISGRERLSYSMKCLIFFFTVSMIYFTYSPRSIDLDGSSSTVRDKVWSTSIYSHSHLESAVRESTMNKHAIAVDFNSVEHFNNFSRETSFSQRAIYLKSLNSSSLPNELTFTANDSSWNCLVNINSYFSSLNLSVFLADPHLMLKLLNSPQIDTKSKHLLNLGIFIDETNSHSYFNTLNNLCSEWIDDAIGQAQSNSTMAKMICDTTKYSNFNKSTSSVNHVYINNFCSNETIQLSVFHKKSSQKYYVVEQVNPLLTQNLVNFDKTSYYGTLGGKQLFDEIDLTNLKLIVPVTGDLVSNVTDVDGDVEEVSPMQSTILVPRDIIDFCLQLYSSKWLPCSQRMNSLEYPSNESVNYNTKMSIVYLKKLLRPLHVPFWLMSGSLLGWFRECRAIPYTTDADFAAFSFSLNPKIVDEIFSKTYTRNKKNTLRLFYRFGKIEKGFELSFILPLNNWKVDLFFMYPTDNSSLISTVGHTAWKNEYLNYYYPSIDSLCSTVLLDEKVNVPCNVMQLIETEYGHDWIQPKENYSYVDSPTNRGSVIKWLRSDGPQVTIYSLARG